MFCLFHIFIFLSRVSKGSAIFWKNPHPLSSCPFSSFPIVFDFLPLNFLLVRSHQTGIIVVKSLIQGEQRVRRARELNLDHTIVITRLP